MRARSIAVLVVVVSAVAVFVGSVMATPATSPGFSGTTLAKATYGEIFSQVHTVPATWREQIQTKGDSDLYVQQNTWDPSLCSGCVPSTGWHTHPGPSFIVVTQGSVTVYDGDDPSCTAHVYTANTANNAFVDDGGGHVHVIRNESGALARTVAVQLVPAAADRRQDTPDPGNCSF